MTDVKHDKGRHEVRSGIRRMLTRGVGLLASQRGAPVFAGLLAFAIVCSRGPAEHFIYDALTYWLSSLALLSGGDTFGIAGLHLRGALTPVVFVPAAVASTLLGPSMAPLAVLVQNAVVIAAMGVMAIPGLVRIVVPVRPFHIYLSATLTSGLLRGFAPYPLVDLWALALVLFGILIVLRNPRWYSFFIGGLLLGIALNLRPAYLVPIVLMLLSWGCFHRLRALWVLPGVGLAVIPQVVVNFVYARSLEPWPVRSLLLTEVQAMYASFIVRFDSLGYFPESNPMLFYCKPAMAERFIDGAPTSSGALAADFLQNLSISVPFVAEKVSASIVWNLTTPYSLLPYPEPSAFAVLVVGVCSVGLLGLIWFLARRSAGSRKGPARVIVPLLALWVGSVATIAFSTPETRFALPLVVVGLVGCIVLAAVFSERVIITRAAICWAAASLVLVIVVLFFGQLGLANPAEPGGVTPRSCSVR